jgi:integrase
MQMDSPECPEVPMSFTKVSDSRGPVPGLWQRGDIFYGQIRLPGKASPCKVPLVDKAGQHLTTVASARDALQALRLKKRESEPLHVARTPPLADYAATYVTYQKSVKAKRDSTIEKEAGSLTLWAQRCGAVRLAQLSRRHVNEFMTWRKGKSSNRTVNLDIIALNNCLNHAIDEGIIGRLPTENLRPLPALPPKRPLFGADEINAICNSVYSMKNGLLFADYFRLLCYSGARRCEALRLKWGDVDFDRKQLTIGADGLAKNHKARTVDFNARLADLLATMHKAKNSDWLFPSPQDAKKERNVKTFKETLLVARTKTGIDMTFHDCRHYFISQAVMAGIDFMTIARWVGHQDGGVLIGKVYGHLSNEHAAKMAEKLKF